MRTINKIIVHCTATPEGREVSLSEIRGWHRQRGFADVGYHFVVGLDGQVHTGRPVEAVGAHCEGRNQTSIGVCYVGGVANDGKTPKDTRTAAQKTALEKLVRELKERFPGCTVHGHCEFSNKACPSFNVAAWLKQIGL